MSFQGFVKLDDDFKGVIISVSTSDVPIDADALPTFRVYGPDGFIIDGTAALLNSGTITGATNANPIVITSANHGLTTGTRVTIASVGGNTNANTTAVVTRLSASTFSIPVAGNGNYTSGGTWHVTGAYQFTVSALASAGFEKSTKYDVLLNYSISASARGQLVSFIVV